MSVLQVENLNAGYGLLRAVQDVSFNIEKAEIVAFVGANGAGKTTLFRTLAGAHHPTSGRIMLEGEDVTEVPGYRRVKRGIALVPEGRRLFASMTVYENLVLSRAARRKGRWTVDSVLEVFSNLKPRLKQKAGTLSGGEQQAAAIARSLMTNPEILLLDEVSLGLSPLAVARVYESLDELVKTNTTILLVEQDLSRALKVATRVICMLEGRIVAQGVVGEITREQIMDAYFGAKKAQADEVATP